MAHGINMLKLLVKYMKQGGFLLIQIGITIWLLFPGMAIQNIAVRWQEKNPMFCHSTIYFQQYPAKIKNGISVTPKPFQRLLV